MTDKVLVKKYGTGWSGYKQWTCEVMEIIEWLAKYGYKAYKADTTADGKRFVQFRKANCLTEYTIIC